MNDMVKKMRKYESVLKQKENIKITGSIFCNWTEREWLFTSMCRRLDDKWIFVITEYGEDMNPCCGIISYAVTEDELEKYFYEDRKRIVCCE